MRQRFFPEDSQKIENAETKAVCYLKAYETGRYSVTAYSGRKTKPDFNYSYKTLERAESAMKEHFEGIQRGIEVKAQWKANQKARSEELKASIEVGTFLRTSFSYNMTFNYFFKVVSKKGNKVVLQPLVLEWVGGDIGYTGNVSATDVPNGDVIEAKFTASGLRVDDKLASICTLNDKFYQNHMD